MNFDPTTKEFYDLWEHDQFIEELIRLNKLLKEMTEDLVTIQNHLEVIRDGLKDDN